MNILENLNKKMEKTVKKEKNLAEILTGSNEKRTVESKGAYDQYEEWKEEKASLAVVFTVADTVGNLSFVDENGIHVVLLADTFREVAPYYTAAIKDAYLRKETIVSVDHIDKDHNTVYLRGGIDTRYKDRQVNRAIKEELENGNKPHVLGRVVVVKNDYVIVNILDQNVQGIISRNDWSKAYIHSLRDHASEGETFEFIVKKESNKSRGGRTQWILTRKQLTEDPWKKFPDSIKEGGSIVVTCVNKPEGKSYWWGICDIIPEIEIMGNYSGKRQITVGGIYECKLCEVNRVRRRIKVSPFGTLESGQSGSIRVLRKKVRSLTNQSAVLQDTSDDKKTTDTKDSTGNATEEITVPESIETSQTTENIEE